MLEKEGDERFRMKEERRGRRKGDGRRKEKEGVKGERVEEK